MMNIKQAAKFVAKAHELGYEIWRGYDIKFQYNWVIQTSDKKSTFYVDYTLEDLKQAVLSLEREDKLKQLGL